MIKFTLRLFKHLLILLLVSIPLQIIGAIILLPVCYLVKSTRLPYYLRWFDCADFYIGRDTSTYENIIKTGAWNRYTWLAWRNPTNYFEYVVLGVKVDYSLYLIETNDINGKVGDSTGDHAGYRYTEMALGDKVIYEYSYIKKWSDKTCLRFRMGYKIGSVKSNKLGSWIQQCLVLSPYKSYSGG
jgi:hypothetical protein